MEENEFRRKRLLRILFSPKTTQTVKQVCCFRCFGVLVMFSYYCFRSSSRYHVFYSAVLRRSTSTTAVKIFPMKLGREYTPVLVLFEVQVLRLTYFNFLMLVYFQMLRRIEPPRITFTKNLVLSVNKRLADTADT